MLTEIIIQCAGGRILNAKMKQDSIQTLMATPEQFIEILHEGVPTLINKDHIMVIRERMHHVT